MAGAEVARRTGWSESKVNRFLHGRVVPKPKDVRAMLQALGVEERDRRAARIIELAELHPSGHASRQHILRAGTIVAQRRFTEIDRSSAHVQTFTTSIVPGLLQSPRYMRAVFTSHGDLTPTEVDDLVAERSNRQALLGDAGERRYTQVMTEGALRWNVGAAAMAEQLDLIAEVARKAPAAVQVGIIPWWRVVDTFPMISINLYDERAVIINTGNGVTHVTAHREVAVFVDEFKHLCGLALFGEDAAAEADRIGTEYRYLAANNLSD